MCVCVSGGGERLLGSDIFFLWLVCAYGSLCKCTCGVVPLFSVITLIDPEKAQMHAIVIIGHQLIFSP